MNLEELAFSVVVPLFNKAETILTSIASVQAQVFLNWELIVVDDGSIDNGPELVAAALGDRRIRLIRQANGGVSAARNRGIKAARNELIAFLDADDIWLPDYLKAVASLVTDFPQAQWFATSYIIQRAKDEYQARLRGMPLGFERGIFQDYYRVAVLSDPPVWSSATVVKREAILSVGGFPTSLSDGEDLLTWARLACKYPMAYDVRPLAIYDFAGAPRPPDPEQRVTQELLLLLNENAQLTGLAAYIGLWNRMQAVKAMRFNDITLARRCAWRAFFYGPFQWRNAYTLLLSLLPELLRKNIDSFLRRLASS